jgi:type 1 glutamine amidotransferase
VSVAEFAISTWAAHAWRLLRPASLASGGGRREVADRDDPLVAFLGETIAVTDEIYQSVLLRLDPTSVDLTQPNVHRHSYGWPLAWTRSYGVGRVFYTALGHEEGVWRDPRFQLLLRNAALWVLRKTA